MKQIESLQQHYIVWLIIGLSSIPYLILQQYGLDAISQWFVPESLTELFEPFSLWRLWTPTFVHYTLPHLIVNLYLWWLFASKIESESRFELISLITIAAAGANICQWSFVGPNFGGLSGVVYALMAYLYLMHRFGGKISYRIDNKLALLMLALIPLSATGLLGKLSNYAHIGGLVCGALFAGLYLGIIAIVTPGHTEHTNKTKEQTEDK